MRIRSKRFFALILATALCFCMVPLSVSAADINYTLNWNNGSSDNVNFTNGAGGSFSVTWTNSSFILGKGWIPGNASRVVNYNAGVFRQTSSSGCTFLELYGWTRNSLIEYRVVDSWFYYKPAEGAKLGVVSSDGGTYDVWKHQQVSQPSISGTQSFWQISSVRQSQRPQSQNNSITFANHVNAWKSFGFNLGNTWDYQILAVEAYKSSGQASVTVW